MRVLQLLILVLPWVAWPNAADPYLAPKAVALQFGLWLLVGWAWEVAPAQSWSFAPRNPYRRWLMAYVLLMGLLHFHLRFLPRTLTDTQVVYNVYTWLPTLAVLVALAAIGALSRVYCATAVATQLVTQWWCLAGGLAACYALGQWAGLDQWYLEAAPKSGKVWQRLSGSFGNPEYLSLYLAYLLPLYGLFKARRYLIFFLLSLVVLAYNRNYGAWMIAAIGMGSYGLARYRASHADWTVWGLASLAPLSFLVLWAWHPTFFLLDERVALWQHGWSLLQAYTSEGLPRIIESWTGRGLGAWEVLHQTGPWLWAHAEWLQGLVELGVIGMGLVAAMTLWTTQRAWQSARTSLLGAGWFGVWMAWLASSMIYPSAHWAHTAWVGLCAWGVVEREGV